MSEFCTCVPSVKTGCIAIDHCNICGKIEQDERRWFNPPVDLELVNRAFVARRSQTSWEQFKEDNNIKEDI